MEQRLLPLRITGDLLQIVDADQIQLIKVFQQAGDFSSAAQTSPLRPRTKFSKRASSRSVIPRGNCTGAAERLFSF